MDPRSATLSLLRFARTEALRHKPSNSLRANDSFEPSGGTVRAQKPPTN